MMGENKMDTGMSSVYESLVVSHLGVSSAHCDDAVARYQSSAIRTMKHIQCDIANSDAITFQYPSIVLSAVDIVRYVQAIKQQQQQQQVSLTDTNPLKSITPFQDIVLHQISFVLLRHLGDRKDYAKLQDDPETIVIRDLMQPSVSRYLNIEWLMARNTLPQSVTLPSAAWLIPRYWQLWFGPRIHQDPNEYTLNKAIQSIPHYNMTVGQYSSSAHDTQDMMTTTNTPLPFNIEGQISGKSAQGTVYSASIQPTDLECYTENNIGRYTQYKNKNNNNNNNNNNNRIYRNEMDLRALKHGRYSHHSGKTMILSLKNRRGEHRRPDQQYSYPGLYNVFHVKRQYPYDPIPSKRARIPDDSDEDSILSDSIASIETISPQNTTSPRVPVVSVSNPNHNTQPNTGFARFKLEPFPYPSSTSSPLAPQQQQQRRQPQRQAKTTAQQTIRDTIIHPASSPQLQIPEMEIIPPTRVVLKQSVVFRQHEWILYNLLYDFTHIMTRIQDQIQTLQSLSRQSLWSGEMISLQDVPTYSFVDDMYIIVPSDIWYAVERDQSRLYTLCRFGIQLLDEHRFIARNDTHNDVPMSVFSTPQQSDRLKNYLKHVESYTHTNTLDIYPSYSESYYPERTDSSQQYPSMINVDVLTYQRTTYLSNPDIYDTSVMTLMGQTMHHLMRLFNHNFFSPQHNTQMDSMGYSLGSELTRLKLSCFFPLLYNSFLAIDSTYFNTRPEIETVFERNLASEYPLECLLIERLDGTLKDLCILQQHTSSSSPPPSVSNVPRVVPLSASDAMHLNFGNVSQLFHSSNRDRFEQVYLHPTELHLQNESGSSSILTPTIQTTSSPSLSPTAETIGYSQNIDSNRDDDSPSVSNLVQVPEAARTNSRMMRDILHGQTHFITVLSETERDSRHRILERGEFSAWFIRPHGIPHVNRLLSCLFQCISGFSQMQTFYSMVQNDQHLQNIMYKNVYTSMESDNNNDHNNNNDTLSECAIYYHYFETSSSNTSPQSQQQPQQQSSQRGNIGGGSGDDKHSKMYRVPTWGKVFKQIDFGRASFCLPEFKTVAEKTRQQQQQQVSSTQQDHVLFQLPPEDGCLESEDWRRFAQLVPNTTTDPTTPAPTPPQYAPMLAPNPNQNTTTSTRIRRHFDPQNRSTDMVYFLTLLMQQSDLVLYLELYQRSLWMVYNSRVTLGNDVPNTSLLSESHLSLMRFILSPKQRAYRQTFYRDRLYSGNENTLLNEVDIATYAYHNHLNDGLLYVDPGDDTSLYMNAIHTQSQTSIESALRELSVISDVLNYALTLDSQSRERFDGSENLYQALQQCIDFNRSQSTTRDNIFTSENSTRQSLQRQRMCIFEMLLLGTGSRYITLQHNPIPKTALAFFDSVFRVRFEDEYNLKSFLDRNTIPMYVL